jgi:hypothetical protein
MKQIGVYCLTLSTVLLTTTPTRAALHAILENPSSVQAVEGISTIAGWAFSTLPAWQKPKRRQIMVYINFLRQSRRSWGREPLKAVAVTLSGATQGGSDGQTRSPPRGLLLLLLIEQLQLC